MEAKVAIMMGMNTSAGFDAPICARMVMMETGIKVSPDALSTRNMIMEFDARDLSGFSSCNSRMACKPAGVAALSNPRMLADKLSRMEPAAGWSFGMSGNRRRNSGCTMRANTCTMPPRSPMRMMPIHKASTPVSPSDTSKPVRAEVKVEFTMSVNACASPSAASRTHATANDTSMKLIQM